MFLSKRARANKKYRHILEKAKAKGNDVLRLTMRKLCLEDLFFLLTRVLNRPDADKDWLFDRCREVQANPDGYLDLWAREHYKSTIITFALTIQDILRDPEITIGIFSFTAPAAQTLLGQIKSEFEKNEILKWLFPDVLFQNPEKESPLWNSEAIIVKRKGNPKEATVEGWGVVKGQPTGRHFRLLIYDDMVTLESVGTPEQIIKTTKAWEMSLNLGSEGGAKRYIGTRYHHFDTYRTMIDRDVVKLRKYPATDNGKADGKPVFMSEAYLEEKKKAMGIYTFASQMLQDPSPEGVQGFSLDWIRYYSDLKNSVWMMNRYLLVDAASSKKTGNDPDYTVMVVIGLGSDGNYYLLDGIRDRLNLTERGNKFLQLHRKWKPRHSGYERYGMMGDVEYIKDLQERENYRFEVFEFGGAMPKNDRIRRLVPVFENARFYLPHNLLYVNALGETKDFIQEFLEEYVNFPLSKHDDMMDVIARIVDKVKYGKGEIDFAEFPKEKKAEMSSQPLVVETKYEWEKF
ncbi:MAG: hypothetical protein PHE89_02705 [Alphaproteobacteria bacterium]|nr:hypothetical protein [Alphaproteobacteria bacterium]